MLVAFAEKRPGSDVREMRDSFALDGEPYHFFASSSFIAAASSICSTSSFFRRAFSSSSAGTVKHLSHFLSCDDGSLGLIRE